jgi:hypothetical protein
MEEVAFEGNGLNLTEDSKKIILTNAMVCSVFQFIKDFRNKGIDLESRCFCVVKKIISEDPEVDKFYTRVCINQKPKNKCPKTLLEILIEFMREENGKLGIGCSNRHMNGLSFDFSFEKKGEYFIQSNA